MTTTKRKRSKQTRRAIGVKAETMEKLQAYAREHGTSVSGLVEKWIDEALLSTTELRLAAPKKPPPPKEDRP